MGSDDDEFAKANIGSRCEWHPATVFRLLDSYAEKCVNGKHNLKTKDWEEILKSVNRQNEGSKTSKSLKQCRDKIDSLKKRYKLEKKKADNHGLDKVNWSFFEKLDEIMGILNKNGNGSESFDMVEATTVVCEAENIEGFPLENRLDMGPHPEYATTEYGVITAESMPALVSPSDKACQGINLKLKFSRFFEGMLLLKFTSNLVFQVATLKISVPGHQCGGKFQYQHAMRTVMGLTATEIYVRLEFKVLNLKAFIDYNLSSGGNSCENRAARQKLQERGLKRRKDSKDRVSERFSKICKTKPGNPIQALADALVGFSEVYARIEIAKMELFTKMNLELAKLQKKEGGNGSSSSSSADSK
eukprot:Gb_10120 [translate_table: standard]